jgi:hypothetical protein
MLSFMATDITDNTSSQGYLEVGETFLDCNHYGRDCIDAYWYESDVWIDVRERRVHIRFFCLCKHCHEKTLRNDGFPEQSWKVMTMTPDAFKRTQRLFQAPS